MIPEKATNKCVMCRMCKQQVEIKFPFIDVNATLRYHCYFICISPYLFASDDLPVSRPALLRKENVYTPWKGRRFREKEKDNFLIQWKFTKWTPAQLKLVKFLKMCITL